MSEVAGKYEPQLLVRKQLFWKCWCGSEHSVTSAECDTFQTCPDCALRLWIPPLSEAREEPIL